MRFWRITFTASGTIDTVEELKGPAPNVDWIIVQAITKQAAMKLGYRLYCARKKKESKTRNHAAGKCACGRAQDRWHPDGKCMLTCTVCAERQKVYMADLNVRKAAGTQHEHVRDEQARAEACSTRVRDRKSEMRLEVLVEVKKAWLDSNTIQAFGQWLEAEVQKCLLRSHSSTDGEKQSMTQ